jgi:hypothetical protein
MSDYVLVRLKRRWVPEWLWRQFGQLPSRNRLVRWLTTEDVDEFTDRRVNGQWRC